tara:strand:- start:1865 stop:2122 length:258 start_codon:yes stop_codon:yes gene_type:complete
VTSLLKLKYVNPKKLKILIGIFSMVGIWGIAFGLWMGTMKASMNYFTIVVLGVINLCLGAFMAYLYLTQEKKIDSRKDSKYKRKK